MKRKVFDDSIIALLLTPSCPVLLFTGGAVAFACLRHGRFTKSIVEGECEAAVVPAVTYFNIQIAVIYSPTILLPMERIADAHAPGAFAFQHIFLYAQI